MTRPTDEDSAGVIRRQAPQEVSAANTMPAG